MRTLRGLIVAALLSVTAFAQNATIEIKAVKKNPMCAGGTRDGLICNLPGDCPGGVCGPDLAAPVSSLAVLPNDRIVTELYARDWSSAGDLLMAYQIVLQNSFPASLGGEVAIYPGSRFCTNNNACSELFDGGCVDGICSPANPRAGAVTIDTSRADYAFFGLAALSVIDISQPYEVRLAALTLSHLNAVPYLGSPLYLGTLAFQVGPQMCGTVAVTLTPFTDTGTVLIHASYQPITPLDLPGLTLIGPGCCGEDLDGDLVPDPCDNCPSVQNSQQEDCDRNGIGDACDPAFEDCQPNGIDDLCDLSAGTSLDCNGNELPDECEPDGDADGLIDACDACPEEFVNDADGDGVCAPQDLCPADADKLAPGLCGCGTPDDDTDADTVPDCLDQCPGADDRVDDDRNGVPDCVAPLPTVSTWGLLILTLVFLSASRLIFRRPKAFPHRR